MYLNIWAGKIKATWMVHALQASRGRAKSAKEKESPEILYVGCRASSASTFLTLRSSLPRRQCVHDEFTSRFLLESHSTMIQKAKTSSEKRGLWIYSFGILRMELSVCLQNDGASPNVLKREKVPKKWTSVCFCNTAFISVQRCSAISFKFHYYAKKKRSMRISLFHI